MGDKSSPVVGWCRCGAIFAIVCSTAACVPPNPAWSSPDPAGQSAEPEESASPYENEGDGVADDDDAEGAPSTAADGDQAGSVRLAGQGKTRADAQSSAISDCNSMMTVDLNRNGSMNMEPSPQGSWGSAISSRCHIAQCYAPARARRGKSSSR